MRTIILLLLSFWFSVTAEAGIVIGSGASSCGVTIFEETFEAMSDGVEWDDYGNWVEDPASTNHLLASSTVAHSGSISGRTGTSALYFAHKAVSAESGKTTVRLWWRYASTPGSTNILFALCAGACSTGGNQVVKIGLGTANQLIVYDNTGTIYAAESLSANTWYKLEIETDHSVTTGINAVRVWHEGAEGTGSPYDTNQRYNPANIDRIAAVTGTVYHYLDDILFYRGATCAQ